MKKAFVWILVLSQMLACAQAFASPMVIASTPGYDDSEAMDNNLSLAIAALNGRKIEKDKTFSFNEVVGPRTEANGFQLAPNGNGQPVVGGGVSQAATTLYLALKELGDGITFDERHSFGSAFSAGYVENARDTALTSTPLNLDFKFTNHSADDLVISMWNGGGTLFCQLTDASFAPEEPAEEPTETPAATPDPTPTQALDDTYRVVNVQSFVNLREGPSTDTDILAEVPKGSAVRYTGKTDEGFMRVEYDGKTGYILEKYLEKAEAGTDWLEIVNCRSEVSLRESASKVADVLANVGLGEKVKSLGKLANGFCQVEYGGRVGYILSDYLREILPQVEKD